VWYHSVTVTITVRITGCNRIRYTNFKIYCDQTSSDIITQFVTEYLSALQVCATWKLVPVVGTWCAAVVHQNSVLYSRGKSEDFCSSNISIQWYWSNGSVVRIIVRKHIRENPFTSGTNHWTCIYAKFNSGRRPNNESMERVHASFLHSLQKYTKRVSRKIGWCLSHDTVDVAKEATVFSAVQISTTAWVTAQWSTKSSRLSNHLVITESSPICRACARQSEGEYFSCCKQNTGLRIILFRRDYHYGSRVPRHAGVLPRNWM
jgi:hypothetical protein